MKVIPLIFSITSGAHTRACSHSDSHSYISTILSLDGAKSVMSSAYINQSTDSVVLKAKLQQQMYT